MGKWKVIVNDFLLFGEAGEEVVSVEILDEGVSIETEAQTINFVGDGVTAALTGTNTVTITVNSGITVQDEGSDLSTALSKLNFVGDGVTVTEPVDDEMLVTVSTAAVIDAGEFCLGWAFTRTDNDTIATSLDVDLTKVFYDGRPVTITDGTEKTGVVASTVYATETTINLTMDDAATIDNNPTQVCVNSSTTSWVPLAAANNPFVGGINDICTGAIGATQWWFAVGITGQVGVSSDGGATWALLTTTTTEDLNCCTYDSTNEKFWGAGDAGVLVSTVNGTSVVEDTSSIPALSGTSTDDITGISHGVSEDVVMVFYKTSATVHAIAVSLSGGAWADGAGYTVLSIANNQVIHEVTTGGDTTAVFHTLRNGNLQTRRVTAYNGAFTTGTTSGLSGTTPSAMIWFWDGAAVAIMFGGFNGNISGVSTWTANDTTSFGQAINRFAYSSTHQRLVCVGDAGTIGHQHISNKTTANAWTAVANGFGASENINSVARNDTDGFYIAVGSDGTICRSSDGTS